MLLFSGSTGRFVNEPQAAAPLFPREVLAFNTRTREWSVAGSMPIGVVTTSITRWRDRIVIPSGEIRPGTRTPKVQMAAIKGELPVTSEPARRPNILFILTDDLAPTAVGFDGHSQLLTPSIDRIPREGVTFVNAFVTTPVCSPSRAGLASSRYSSELGILDWINPSEEPELGLDPSLVTWMEVLQQAGYATGLAGKWHLGTADRFHPTRTGYDWFAGFRDGGRPPKDAVLEIDGRDIQTEGFIVDVVTDQALGFLERQGERPFLMSVHYREPHAKWLPTREEDFRPYRDILPRLPEPDFPLLDVPKVQRMSREYFASVASVDRNVGRLLEALDRRGLTDNTIVIFTSDHGYHTGHHGLWFKGNAQWMTTVLPEQRWSHIPPAQRPNLYDQALRVPTAIRWPRVIAAGTVVTQTFTNLDWYPTLLAMAGVEVPADVLLHGRNALPLLRGETIDWDDTLYAEYSMRHGATTDMRALRTGEWKLMIDFANEGRGELYDLVSDPLETMSLFESADPHIVEVRERLTEQLLQQSRALSSFPAPDGR